MDLHLYDTVHHDTTRDDIVSMGIIVKKKIQMYPIMGGGNVDMWHDCMYVHYTLVAM